MTGWIFVFIPDIMWRKFGNRARDVSAKFFLLMGEGGVKLHLLHDAHITALVAKERLHAA